MRFHVHYKLIQYAQKYLIEVFYPLFRLHLQTAQLFEQHARGLVIDGFFPKIYVCTEPIYGWS